MISTRLHGAIDWGVAAAMGAAASGRALHPATRRVLGAAGAFHAATSAATDYEAGWWPLLTIRQHYACDVLGAAGLCAAALGLRAPPARERALLLAAGLAEIGVVALSATRTVAGPGRHGPVARVLLGPEADARAGYPPFDAVKAVADDVWVVDAAPMHRALLPLPLRMVVLRIGGALMLVSPTPHSPEVQAALEALGPIRWLVAPSMAHWMFVRGWQAACPGAAAWGAPVLARRGVVRRAGLRFDRLLADGSVTEWPGIETVRVPGGLGFEEFALFHAPSRTLVLTDLVTNLEAERFPAPLRPVLRALGMAAPDGRAPAYLRAIVSLRRREAAAAADRLVALAPRRVMFAHGWWFGTDAAARLAWSLRWLRRRGARWT